MSKKKNENLEAMNERQALPLGAKEFEVWSDRIISGTMLEVDAESQKFALATMILSLGPTEDFKEDAYFIHALRKAASNQVAHAKMTEIKEAAQARFSAQEAAKTTKPDEATSQLKVVANEGKQ